jgi:hypothetical protein
MLRQFLCWLLGHKKPEWRKLNGVMVEVCARCGHVYRMENYRTLDDM